VYSIDENGDTDLREGHQGPGRRLNGWRPGDWAAGREIPGRLIRARASLLATGYVDPILPASL
jgi:hypothetical protein